MRQKALAERRYTIRHLEGGTITHVPGIQAAGVFCGIKKTRKDIALIYSETPCTAAGTFTLNKVKAAPALLSQQQVRAGGKFHAVLVNSGNANACTGDEGMRNAITARNLCAERLGVKPEEVLVSSTGVIGQQLPMEQLLSGIEQIVPALTAEGGNAAAEAIMTTDRHPKEFAVQASLSGGTVTLGGICKGSGMIMPNMATMLAFLATDAAIPKDRLQQLLSAAVNDSFNCITVDGDTSTNDMVILLANGTSGIAPAAGSADENTFYEALLYVCREMAKSIIVDGEGATKLIQIDVTNAGSKPEANAIARTIANSPLVKTAFYGCDANWGRIISAVGNSGAEINPDRISIWFNDVPVLLQDYAIVLDEQKAKDVLSKSNFTVTVDIGKGNAEATWWTCDFTEGYIKINASYRS